MASPRWLESLKDVVPVVAAIASIVASTSLLCGLRRLSALQQSKLLVRQLWHLAVSNLVNMIPESLQSLAALVLLDGGSFAGVTAPEKDMACIGAAVVSKAGSWTTLGFEVHLAVSFATSICGSARTMGHLYDWLVYVWPVMVLLSLWDTWKMQISFEEGEGCAGANSDYFFSAFASFGCFVNLACYVGSSVSVFRAGHVVQRAVWIRAQRYMLVGLVTLCPLILYYICRDAFKSDVSHDVAFLVADGLYDFSGLLNYLVYVSQSKIFSRPAQEQNGTESGGVRRPMSFRVNFRRDGSLVEEQDPSATRSAVTSDSNPSHMSLVDYYEGGSSGPSFAARWRERAGGGGTSLNSEVESNFSNPQH